MLGCNTFRSGPDILPDFNRDYLTVGSMQADDRARHSDISTEAHHTVSELLPHHARAQPRILEAIDQARRIVRSSNRFPHCFKQRQILYALRGPIGPNLCTRDAPDFLRVALEKGLIQAQ